MLTAYFDESGHSATLGFFALAALVAPSELWSLFDAEWKRALGECNAPYLHMREFAHRLGPYEGWPEERRRTLLGGCVYAIKATHAVAIGAVLNVHDFNSLSNEDRFRMQDPFFCCFQEVVRGAAINGVFEDSNVKVNMAFSTQDEFRGRAISLYEAMLQSSDVRDRIGCLSFDDMRDSPGLQAADLVAYELRQHYQLGREEPPRPTRWEFREIVEHQRYNLGVWMLKYLPRWYLNAQAEHNYKSVMSAILADPHRRASFFTEITPILR